MNRKGFTLVELLGSLAILAIVFVIGLCAARGTVAMSLIGVDKTNEEAVYNAATTYVLDRKASFNDDNYTCVYVGDLIDYGYLSGNINGNLRNRMVRVSRNNLTKVITTVKFDDKCK